MQENSSDINKNDVNKPSKKDKKTKKKKTKKKKVARRPVGSKKAKVFSYIIAAFVFLFVAAAGACLAFAILLCKDMPELKTSDLIGNESSVIYDNEGNKIMEIGEYLRQNINYEDMPNCLIDAFLAVEDSRYFEHIGFDIPRFTKSALNILRGGQVQGGSTIDMQLIKNSYFSIDDGDNSTIASREGMSGVRRKMQEIVLSLQLEFNKEVNKKQIIAMYINKVNYGSNIRGIEKAAIYYFGKSASDLNLTEAAFLAGIVNEPNSYNPYNNIIKFDNIYFDEDTDYLAQGTQRRDEVLDLMVYHGYINEQEAELAKSVRIEDLIVGRNESFFEVNEKFQWYIDAVIDEVIEETGESPYQIGMEIYTNMNPYMQEYIYDMQNEADYTGLRYPNDECQSAIVLLDNQTGAIEALGGGRGEVNSARQFNRATSAYLNPGSSIKPVVDYSLAIENCGWATSHTITDQPLYLYNGNVLISNFDHIYYGDMEMVEAIGRSQNTPAIQTLEAVIDKLDEEKIIDYLNSIGFDFSYDDFDLQFGIGQNRCVATPVQMAGAHSIFMNDGMYVKPHTINYIKYANDSREDYVADTIGTRALSSQTAWMTAYLEYMDMYGKFSSLMWYCKRGYPLYGKTGTTDWGDSGVSVGIPVGATKDSWLVMQTNRYTISCWTGYDELAKGAYFTNAEYQENTKSKIVSKILDQLETHASYKDYDPSIKLEKPEGVKEITHIRGTFPYVLAPAGENTSTGYIWDKWLEENTGTLQENYNKANANVKRVIAGISNIVGQYDGNNVNVQFEIGGGEGGLLQGESVDLSTTNGEGETTHCSGRIYFPHWRTVYTGSVNPPYYYRVVVNGVTTATGETGELNFSAPAPGGTSCDVYMWTNNEDGTPNQETKVTIKIG